MSLPHVEPARLRELQSRLEELSGLNLDFIVLLASSTLIATFGLFQNSPAVIIGAMIIAPLMRPLVGLSLATMTADVYLLMRASITLVAGTLVAVFLSALMAFLLHSLEFTPEILGRTHPTMLDLGVAIAAGACGAYCQTSKKLTESLAGVAIAVALVPPLCVVGIGIAFNSFPTWSGASLLYATNLIGITFAGALVFLVMGFTPLERAKKGLAVSSAICALLLVPLGLSMRELILENQISRNVKTTLKEKTFTFKDLQLEDVQVQGFKSPLTVVATVYSPEQPITGRQVALVQSFLSGEIGMPVEFKLRIIPSREIRAEEGETVVATPGGDTAPVAPLESTTNATTPPTSTAATTVDGETDVPASETALPPPQSPDTVRLTDPAESAQ